MPFKLTFKLTGRTQIMRTLGKLPDKLQKTTLRNALAAGGGVIKRAVQARAPVRTGLMRRAMRVKGVRHKSGAIGYRVMPRSEKKALAENKSGQLKVATKKRVGELERQGARIRYANPALYAHLVELGHEKRGGGRVRGTHFMLQAFRATRRQALKRISEKVRQALARYRARK